TRHQHKNERQNGQQIENDGSFHMYSRANPMAFLQNTCPLSMLVQIHRLDRYKHPNHLKPGKKRKANRDGWLI
ncbi:MAG: hypothetical protein J6N54_05340, partial [Bacteroidales bacterium]|nr:hypothetical protein [Bacteroidales bacterium]